MNEDRFQKLIQNISNKNVKYYDDDINTPALKTIKAIVAYMDYKYQRQIGIIIKLVEIQMLMDMYDKNTNLKNENDFESAIINAMKIHINNDNMKILQQALQIKNMFENKNNGKGDEMEKILNDDAFKNLSAENIELLKNFMHDISGKSQMEAVQVVMQYSQKLPKDITKEQKDAIVAALLKKMPTEKQQQFLNLYKMFGK